MTTVTALSSYFTTLIDNIMLTERQPVERLTSQKDSINVQINAYNDLKTRLGSMQTAVDLLRSSQPEYAVKAGRAVSVSPATSGSTVLTASASSDSIPGSYEISVTQRALAQRRASTAFSSTDRPLNLSGTFWLGGSGTAAASVTPNDTVSGASSSAVTSGLKELGTDTYTVETRLNEGVLQFRIKNADGNIVSVASKTGSGAETTSSWQNVSAGEYNTGRGFSITFGEAGVEGTTDIAYTAAGTSISVATSDTLAQIADKINDAEQSEGREINASVVGTQLVLSAANTGTKHTMIYTDQVGLNISGTDLQAARDASFTVNNIAFTSSINTGMTSIIHGVTLNLAADSDGKTATLNVRSDMSAARTAIDGFLNSFNSVQAYLASKTAITEVNDGDTRTYVRGSLANDTVFGDLRTSMFFTFMENSSNSGIYKSLREIGLSIDDNLKAQITDENKLAQALDDNLDDVTALFDSVMERYSTSLSRFTGATTGYLNQAVTSYQNQIKEIDSDIQSQNLRLQDRQLMLINQYAQLQTQIMSMTYAQSLWSTIYGQSNNS